MFIDTLKRRWPEYLLEIGVIIVGITLSFLLNEWRADRSEAEAEIRALASLRDDLVADTTMISNEIQQMDKFDSALNYMIRLYQKDAQANRDSILAALTAYATYTTFNKNSTGYEQLKETGQLNIISNKALLKSVVELYNDKALVLKEYSYIDRSMVLEQFIPFLMKDATMFFVDNPMRKTKSGKALYEELMEQKYFRNSLLVNRIFKSSIIQYYREYFNDASGLIEQIDIELARLR